MQSQMITSRLGGELLSYKLDGVEKIHQGQECIDEYGKIYWKRHFPVLFPIVGKLKQNKTIINGRTYEMSQHGFARDMEFEPITKLDNFHSYVLRSNPSTLAKYPFEFSLYITYRTDENKLTTIYKVVNDGDNNMPFGIGGHPAFKIDMEDLLNLIFSKVILQNKLVLLEVILSKVRFSCCFIFFEYVTVVFCFCIKYIMKGITSNKISLKRRRGNKTLLTMDFEGFPYLGVWSKPGAPFLCIEPWYSTADAVKSTGVFAQKSDILVLAPKKEFECKFTVEFFN